MLAGRVRLRSNLSPRGRRGTGSDLTTEHLLTADPASSLIGLIEPGLDDIHCKVHVPHADQVLVEAFVPHKAMCMVRSIWHNNEHRTV